ncbi:hypothetical protein [Chryseolinea soli]|uniref:Lipocalin-like domain-containing protein n=1 Tax=Chryseolinea soli TaxID=2321403 RepID=A0A385SYR6_9BACT|nr:hypothetical protein [Chryseolinea soli]AYB35257.1 hypothetical protein D4L85_33800 [Chryseolinea soli]
MRRRVQLCCLFLVLLEGCSDAGHDLSGTWIRSKNGNVSEIFIVLPNGDFVSNLIDDSNQVAIVEKGAWRIQNDSVTFQFLQVVQVNDSTRLVKSPGDEPPVTYKFSFDSFEELKIGSTLYKRL